MCADEGRQSEHLFFVPITAAVWCIGICIQHLIVKTKFDVSILYELLASFVFSVGVGTILLKTDFIAFTMVAHFVERILSAKIRRKIWVREE